MGTRPEGRAMGMTLLGTPLRPDLAKTPFIGFWYQT